MLSVLAEEAETNDARHVSNQEVPNRASFPSTVPDGLTDRNGIAPSTQTSARSDMEAFQQSNAVKQQQTVLMRGVVFGRSVRMSFCSIHVARLLNDDSTDTPFDASNVNHDTKYNDCLCDDDDEEDSVALIRMQFMSDNVVSLRSYCRRFVKNGDLISVVASNGCVAPTVFWQACSKEICDEPNRPTSVWQAPRLVVNVQSIEHAAATVRVVQSNFWSMRRYQPWQRRYLTTTPVPLNVVHRKRESPTGQERTSLSHGNGLNKRIQGEYLASFLFHMIALKMLVARKQTDSFPFPVDTSTWALSGLKSEGMRSSTHEVVSFLNSGSGVFDVAGGSGHVSMALGLMGVHSTVIDPRENAGKLPKRDRKFWQKTVKVEQPLDPNRTLPNVENVTEIYCQRISVPFDTIRSFFGVPPVGIDVSYRHPDQNVMSVISDDQIQHCSAIVALHPDEATDAIVDTAVRLRIPFLIVPCCVFNRLFPNRRIPDRPNDPVSTHNDLIEYLLRKDPSIQKATLPFEGSNTVLWSIF